MGQNGHVVGLAAKQAASEARRRQLDAAYVALPELLLADLERLAMAQELNVRLGALQLVTLIRRRRSKALLGSDQGQ